MLNIAYEVYDKKYGKRKLDTRFYIAGNDISVLSEKSLRSVNHFLLFRICNGFEELWIPCVELFDFQIHCFTRNAT